MKKKMPDSISEVFKWLDNDLTHLSVRWKIYRQLYGAGPKRIELLNKVASTFFYEIHYSLIDDIMMSICRLLDPASTLGHDNLTFEQLAIRIRTEGYIDLADELNQKIEDLRTICGPITQHRNKRIGHIDLDRRLNPESNTLPSVTGVAIAEIFDGIADFMNDVNIYFNDSSTLYDFTQTQSDGETLIEALKSAIVYDSMRDKDMMAWWKRRDESEFGDA